MIFFFFLFTKGFGFRIIKEKNYLFPFMYSVCSASYVYNNLRYSVGVMQLVLRSAYPLIPFNYRYNPLDIMLFKFN